MIDTEILEDYSSEARELLDEMDDSLIRLEKEGSTPELLNNVFRAAHCIKGSAEYIGLERTSTLTHGVENLLDRLREGSLPITPQIVEFLFRAKDKISQLINEVTSHHEERSEISALMEELDYYLAGKVPSPPAEELPEPEAVMTEEKAEEVEEPEDVEEIPEESLESELAAASEESSVSLDLDEEEIAQTELEDIGSDEEEHPVTWESDDVEVLSEEDEEHAVEPTLESVGEETTTGEELVAGTTLEETVPHLLNLTLYLDDLEDGLDAGEVLPSIGETVHNLILSLDYIGVDGAVEILKRFEAEIQDLMHVEGPLNPETVKELRNTLYELSVFYPPETLPDKETTLPEAELTPDEIDELPPAPTSEGIEGVEEVLEEDVTEEEKRAEVKRAVETEEAFTAAFEEAFEEAFEPQPEGAAPVEEIPRAKTQFEIELEEIAGVTEPLARAIRVAGYTNFEQLTSADTQALNDIPGMTEAIMAAIRSARPPETEPTSEPTLPQKTPGERSMMEDVDEEILQEFESVMEPEPTMEAREAAPTAQAEAEEAYDPRGLLDEISTVGEETDREILQIFLSYGKEILESLKPRVEKAVAGEADAADLNECAESIKSIRSSSTYMDYQRLADFLDEWYEGCLWAATKIESLGADELTFMDENLRQLETFLNGLERGLEGEALPAAEPQPEAEAVTVEPTPVTREEPIETTIDTAMERETTITSEVPTLSEELPLDEDLALIEEKTGELLEAPEETTVEQSTPEREPTAEIEGMTPSITPEESPTAVTGPVTAVAPSPRPKPEPTAPTEEIPSAPPRFEEPSPRPEPAAASDVAPEAPVVRTMRVDAAKVDTLLNQVGELVVNRSYVEQLSLELKNLQRELMSEADARKKDIQAVKEISLKVAEASLSLGRVATDLQEGVMKLRMLPVGQLFNRMPRLIRDLSRRVNKSVTLKLQGSDTEVDKRVIEQIYNPLVHLIRNAVDHGIEDKETRKRLGKSEEASISLSAYSQGNQVVIDVEDDGRGINAEAVVQKAVENRLIDSSEVSNLAMQDIYNFLFVPGFSTSQKVTRTSGRGVGMDVVKRDVEKINGHVEIESWKNVGTRISIKIPLTLAIIETLLIRSGRHVFAIPLTQVREIIQIAPAEIETIEGSEVIRFREETIPILRTADVFQLNHAMQQRDAHFVVLATTGTKSVGFLVEELVGEQDVVIKPLAEHVFKSRGLAGSTILGDGTIALVMDVAELIDDIITKKRQRYQRETAAHQPRDESQLI